MVTIDIFDLFRTVVAPEFAAKTDPEILAFQDEAEIEISQSVFGARYPRAVALLTAHLMVMAKKSAENAGAATSYPLKRVKVGQLEREYNTAGPVDASDGSELYKTTSYGKEFLRLRKQVLTSLKFVSV